MCTDAYREALTQAAGLPVTLEVSIAGGETAVEIDRAEEMLLAEPRQGRVDTQVGGLY